MTHNIRMSFLLTVITIIFVTLFAIFLPGCQMSCDNDDYLDSLKSDQLALTSRLYIQQENLQKIKDEKAELQKIIKIQMNDSKQVASEQSSLEAEAANWLGLIDDLNGEFVVTESLTLEINEQIEKLNQDIAESQSLLNHINNQIAAAQAVPIIVGD